MYKVYKSINDHQSVANASDFNDAALCAQDILAAENNLHLILVFFQSDSMERDGQRRLAGIVYRKEVIDLDSLQPYLYMEVQVKTVFEATNIHYCHEPSLLSLCTKLIDYHNTITSIRPVTQKEFYEKLRQPLPF